MSPHPDSGAESPTVAIIILNWNAWADTIECLESLCRLRYPRFHIFVCDNASTDHSAERISQWIQGDLCVLPADQTLTDHRNPPDLAARDTTHLTLIENPSNLGFAAGNNVGLRTALDKGFDLFWILNADTVVDPDALTQLVDRIQSEKGVGLCGSLLCYYEDRSLIQEAGGCTYYPLLGLSKRLAADRKRETPTDWRRLEAKLEYISGASCLVTRDFLETVGLMSEDYFLYCEEIDWATRAKGRFSLALSEKSIVYHKKGLATGSKTHGRTRSPSSTYYLWRARKRYSQKYYPAGLVGLFGFGLIAVLGHILRKDTATAGAILSGLTDRPPKEKPTA